MKKEIKDLKQKLMSYRRRIAQDNRQDREDFEELEYAEYDQDAKEYNDESSIEQVTSSYAKDLTMTSQPASLENTVIKVSESLFEEPLTKPDNLASAFHAFRT